MSHRGDVALQRDLDAMEVDYDTLGLLYLCEREWLLAYRTWVLDPIEEWTEDKDDEE